METVGEKIVDWILKSLKIFSVFFTLFLWLSVTMVTSYVNDMSTQVTMLRENNILLAVVIGVLSMVACCMFVAWMDEKGCTVKKSFWMIAVLWIGVNGGFLIIFGKSVPTADAMSVYKIAESLSMGDMSVIHPTDSYLSYYPHQIGLAAFLELLFDIWNIFGIDRHAYHFIKGIYVILTIVTVYFGYRIVDKMWSDSFVNGLFLCFSALNLPMIMYSSFIYGEVPAVASFVVGIYCLLVLVEKQQFCLQGILSILFFSVCVLLKKNTLILVIAVCLAVICEGIKRRKKTFMVMALTYLLGALCILPIVQKGYEQRAGNDLSSGVTALSYLAMGMQEGFGASGFYNGFNFDTYVQSGLNTDIANEISWEAIEERLQYFKENPRYALGFYKEKYLAQWADSTYDSLQVTVSDYGGRSAFFCELYDGKYMKYYIGYCKIFQIVIFFGAFLFSIIQFLKKYNSTKRNPRREGFIVYIGLIGVLGGFLFHMIWEASARYIYIYSLLLVPYAACGMGDAYKAFREKWLNKKTGQDNLKINKISKESA